MSISVVGYLLKIPHALLCAFLACWKEAFHHGLHSFREEFDVLGIAASAAFRIASVTLKTVSSTSLFWTIVPVIIANRVNLSQSAR
ncbi:hypothetical protein TNCV_3919771 [Trichonephila clavipes]|nr:hypothetical protein TNCV_3919771 [Trichonephila clavipes]